MCLSVHQGGKGLCTIWCHFLSVCLALGGLCLWSHVLSGGFCPVGSLSSGISVQGSLSREGFCRKSDKRAVRMLLDCLLSFKLNCRHQHIYSTSIFMNRLQLPQSCVWVSFPYTFSFPFQYFTFDSCMSGGLWDCCVSHIKDRSRVLSAVSVSKNVQ